MVCAICFTSKGFSLGENLRKSLVHTVSRKRKIPMSGQIFDENLYTNQHQFWFNNELVCPLNVTWHETSSEICAKKKGDQSHCPTPYHVVHNVIHWKWDGGWSKWDANKDSFVLDDKNMFCTVRIKLWGDLKSTYNCRNKMGIFQEKLCY